jgi:deoxyribodipyrimidine photolyase-related protein
MVDKATDSDAGRPCRLCLVLGDQLSRDLATLQDLDPGRDIVLMLEVHDETVYVPHHKQKIALILATMRHFARALEAEGITVDYVRLDEPDNEGSFSGEVARAIARHKPDALVVTEPGEWRVWRMMQDWREELGIPVEIREDDRFLCSREVFAQWADGRKALRMEYFYREMRKKTGFLMEADGDPVGGSWNFDAENRKALPADLKIPAPKWFAPDAITQEVLDLVEERFPEHFGRLDGFAWAVTREDALRALDAFINERLCHYGDYQDAMKRDEPFLFHALISPYLNCGLLLPREVCEAAQAAYDAGKAPLNAVEGFIRQIIGWREYVRGIYWLRMPDYARTNALEARRALPDFYWSAKTDMACMRACVEETRDHAYAHHIQRLMVLGNFALLAGITPQEVQEWYLLVYADAYEWVELPNVHGMVLFADGGLLASKPYAASGAYIDRMSDYCKSCRYDVKQKLGEKACPFNYLYWNFLIENEDRLKGNPRMGMPYRNLSRMSDERRAAISADASAFLDAIGATERE